MRFSPYAYVHHDDNDVTVNHVDAEDYFDPEFPDTDEEFTPTADVLRDSGFHIYPEYK